jgi:hypothetical protein
MPKIKISWEDERQGTVSAWIDQETREIVRQDGEPNPGYYVTWKGEVRRMTANTTQAEMADPLILEFKERDRADVIRARNLYLQDGFTYEQIAARLYRSRSTIYRWLKALNLVKERKK